MPITDFSVIDTTPGKTGVFSPPVKFAGGEDDYAAWFTTEFRNSLGTRQQMAVLTRFVTGSRFGFSPEIVGPYASRLHKMCKKMEAHSKEVPERGVATRP